MPPREIILGFQDARHLVEEHARRMAAPPAEIVPLEHSGGRVLAQTIVADRDFPPFRRAARDGFALHTSDLNQLPARLRIVGEIRAGANSNIQLTRGETAAIMTGAPAPDGADAVVMVEYTSRDGDFVQIEKAVSPGENIVPTGAEARQGDKLAPPGTRVDPATIALAASVGLAQLAVYRRPRAAILATGDEIVPVDKAPAPNQIRNSNTWSLAEQIRRAGGDPVCLPIAPDEKSRLRELIQEGLRCDLLLLSGGVSAGDYDFVEPVLSELNADFFFTGARIQPGKPIAFGKCGPYFFGLPGNPISTMVTFELFVRPLLEGLSGTPPAKLVFLHARLKSAIKTKLSLTRFLPAVLSGEFGEGTVALVPWQGSGDLTAVARSNCYIVIPPDRDLIPAGEWVPILPRQ
jgi:molybdopterin molybdotransferase